MDGLHEGYLAQATVDPAEVGENAPEELEALDRLEVMAIGVDQHRERARLGSLAQPVFELLRPFLQIAE